MTVCSLIQSWRPISRFESPRATASRTAVSRSLSAVSPAPQPELCSVSAPQTVNGAAGERRAQHGGQIDRLDGLDDVAAGAALTGRLDLLGVAVAREDDDGHVRVVLAQPLEAGEAVELGHAQVEQDDVRRRLADGGDDVAADRDLVDDLEVVRVGERAPDRGLHQPVVVRNEYAKSLHSRSPFLGSRRRESTQH